MTTDQAYMEMAGKQKNHLHRFKTYVMQDFFEDCILLAEVFGYTLFEVLTEESIAEKEQWFCSSKHTIARAVYEGAGFTVLAGSLIDASHASSWEVSAPRSLQERKEILSVKARFEGEVYVLKENVTFKSPNHAGGFRYR